MWAIVLVVMLTAASQAGPVTEMELSNGIRVISRKLETGGVEGVSLFIEGGFRALDGETQGLEAFALESALMGGGAYSGPRLRELTDTTLAEITGSYNYDFSRIHLRCLGGDLPLLLDAVSDCITHPEMDPSAVEKVRQGMLADLAEREGDADQARRHLSSRLRAGNLLVTHAGSTPDSVLLPLLEGAFGGIPRGGGDLPAVPPFPLERDNLITEQRQVETAYAVVKFESPPAGHPDRPAFVAAMNAISDVLWNVLRTEHNLTYATYSGSTGYRRNWGYMYLSSPEPQRACSLMAGVYRRAASEGLDPELIRGSVETLRTSRGSRMASRDTQCWLLGVGEISGEGWESVYFLIDSLAALEPADLQQVLGDWAGPCAWGIIAPPGRLEDLEGPWPLR